MSTFPPYRHASGPTLFSNTNNYNFFFHSNFLFSWWEILPNGWEPASKPKWVFAVWPHGHLALIVDWMAGLSSTCSSICVVRMLPQGCRALGSSRAVWNLSSRRLFSKAPLKGGNENSGSLGFYFVTLVLSLPSSPRSGSHMHRSVRIKAMPPSACCLTALWCPAVLWDLDSVLATRRQ